MYLLYLQDKTRETLVSYVVYLKEQSEGQNVSINIEELQGYVRLVTNKGLKNPKECAIHFTPLYGNEIDLPRILPGKLVSLLFLLHTSCDRSIDLASTQTSTDPMVDSLKLSKGISDKSLAHCYTSWPLLAQ